MSLKTIRRGALVLLLDAVVLMLLSEAMDGFVLDGAATALGAAALIGLLNALVWPVLARFALPLTVLTLGLGALLLNGLLVTIAIDLLPGAHIRGLFEGTVITIVIAAVTAAVYSLLAIDEDHAWHRQVVRRQARRRKQVVESEVPGVLFLEIDGLAHDVLLRALQDGSAPHLAGWVRGGSHRLRCWETDWSSQTGACQAGLLHGSNEDMPAFRWWEKERGAAIVTNHPRDAEELERRHSDGQGLLHADGASRANILSGDAPHSMLTMSTALRRRRPIGRDYGAYFAQPYAVARTFVLALADVGRERRAARGQVRDDVRPRMERSLSYAFVRAWGTVVQRDLQVAAVVGDVLAGRPVVYTTFLAYDEVAHHSGIERHDALAVLRDLDRQIARIATACAEAPRPYRLVVLSDHGQSQGETFRDRYGQTLEDVVRDACDPDSVVAAEDGDDDVALLHERRADRAGARRHRHRPHGAAGDAGPAGRRRGRPRLRVPAGDGRVPRRRGPGALGDGLGMPRADQSPARAGPGQPGADRSALPAACCRPCASTPGSASSSSAPSARGRWRSAPRGPTTSTPAGSRERTRWRRSAPTPPITCGAPTASRTAPT